MVDPIFLTTCLKPLPLDPLSVDGAREEDGLEQTLGLLQENIYLMGEDTQSGWLWNLQCYWSIFESVELVDRSNDNMDKGPIVGLSVNIDSVCAVLNIDHKSNNLIWCDKTHNTLEQILRGWIESTDIWVDNILRKYVVLDLLFNHRDSFLFLYQDAAVWLDGILWNMGKVGVLDSVLNDILENGVVPVPDTVLSGTQNIKSHHGSGSTFIHLVSSKQKSLYNVFLNMAQLVDIDSMDYLKLYVVCLKIMKRMCPKGDSIGKQVVSDMIKECMSEKREHGEN